MRVAGPRWRPTVDEVIRGMGVQQRKSAVVERRFDELAEAAARALLQSHENAERGVHPAHHVDDRQPDAQGTAVRFAVDAHDSA